MRASAFADLPIRTLRNLPLAAVLAVAAVARLAGINFGFPHLNCRPDEGAVVSIAGGMYNGDLNPHFFNYPALFMLAVAAAFLMWNAGGLGVTATTTFRIARYLSAAAGIASVLMLFRIGLRLFGHTAALAAAALLSLAFLHVRDSHFGVTDVPMTFMVLVAFLFIVRLAESGGTRDLVAAGVTSGLATSTKYNAALIALPLLLAILTDPSGIRRPGYAPLRRAALCISIMAAAFLLSSPYSLLDFRRFLADFTFESRHLTQGHGVIVGRGWSHHLMSSLRYGVGSPILVTGLAGFGLLLWRDPRKGSLVALFPVSYYLVLGSGYTVFARYMLPVVPFLCLSAGYVVTEAARWLAARLRRPELAPILVTAGVVGLLWPSVQSVVAFDQLMTLDDNRLLARRWVERHFPKGTTIAQLGSEGSRVYLHDIEKVVYPRARFRRRDVRPDLVVVPSSPLRLVPRDLRGMEQILAQDYELGFARAGVGSHPENIYDWQDDFYLPLTGFEGIERPGPNLKIYIRRGAFPNVPRRNGHLALSRQ